MPTRRLDSFVAWSKAKALREERKPEWDRLKRLLAHEHVWRAELGGEIGVGEFIGVDRWRRISETWEAPDPDDIDNPDAAIAVAARLADYVSLLEPLRRA